LAWPTVNGSPVGGAATGFAGAGCGAFSFISKDGDSSGGADGDGAAGTVQLGGDDSLAGDVSFGASASGGGAVDGAGADAVPPAVCRFTAPHPYQRQAGATAEELGRATPGTALPELGGGGAGLATEGGILTALRSTDGGAPGAGGAATGAGAETVESGTGVSAVAGNAVSAGPWAVAPRVASSATATAQAW
jgi:hypothetical protein